MSVYCLVPTQIRNKHTRPHLEALST